MPKESEVRLHNFAKRTRDFCLKLKWDIINSEYIKQLVRSSGSVGANYIEASDDLGKLDERMKIKISGRESKESIHWFDLVLTYENKELDEERTVLMDEADQMKKILSAILSKPGKPGRPASYALYLEPCTLYLEPCIFIYVYQDLFRRQALVLM